MIRITFIVVVSMVADLFISLLDLVLSLPISKKICLSSHVARHFYVANTRRNIHRQLKLS